jgi:hypothetical protein
MAAVMSRFRFAYETGCLRSGIHIDSRIGAHFGLRTFGSVECDDVSVRATPGTFSGARPSMAVPDAPPGEDDRTGYVLERLPIGHSYLVYAEPLNGAVDPSQIGNSVTSLCRNSSTDGGWPILLSSVMPAVNSTFMVRTRPGP